jgi:hypothetical protein
LSIPHVKGDFNGGYTEQESHRKWVVGLALIADLAQATD